jgi:hypothetical protein
MKGEDVHIEKSKPLPQGQEALERTTEVIGRHHNRERCQRVS